MKKTTADGLNQIEPQCTITTKRTLFTLQGKKNIFLQTLRVYDDQEITENGLFCTFNTTDITSLTPNSQPQVCLQHRCPRTLLISKVQTSLGFALVTGNMNSVTAPQK